MEILILLIQLPIFLLVAPFAFAMFSLFTFSVFNLNERIPPAKLGSLKLGIIMWPLQVLLGYVFTQNAVLNSQSIHILTPNLVFFVIFFSDYFRNQVGSKVALASNLIVACISTTVYFVLVSSTWGEGFLGIIGLIPLTILMCLAAFIFMANKQKIKTWKPFSKYRKTIMVIYCLILGSYFVPVFGQNTSNDKRIPGGKLAIAEVIFEEIKNNPKTYNLSHNYLMQRSVVKNYYQKVMGIVRHEYNGEILILFDKTFVTIKFVAFRSGKACSSLIVEDFNKIEELGFSQFTVDKKIFNYKETANLRTAVSRACELNKANVSISFKGKVDEIMHGRKVK
jgi:hypothetical protein